MQSRIHQPLNLHAHAGDGRVGVRHVLFDAEAFVHDSHAGAGVEVCDGMGEVCDFVAEGLVDGEEVGCCI